MSLPPLLDTLKDSRVRDLAWLVSSPNLLNAPQEQIVPQQWFKEKLPDIEQQLHNWDQNPEELHAHCRAEKSHFLGPYFEQLVAFLIKQSPSMQITAQRMQLHARGKTLGEYDLLLHDAQTQQYFHWELAIKYYLGYPQNKRCYWVGPNVNDRLDLKYHKLFNEQLQLSKRHPASLRDIVGNATLFSQALVKGYLMFPLDEMLRAKVNIPHYVSPEHQRGWWTRWDGTLTALDESSCWGVLHKPHWLACPRFSKQTVMTKSRLLELLEKHFAKGNKALLLCELLPKGDAFFEVSRGFVLPRDWPGEHLFFDDAD